MNFIMLIDDDPVSQRIMELLIKRVNPSIVPVKFYPANAALGYLIENASHPDRLPPIIFLDLYMPGMNGWQFLKEFEKLITMLNKKITVYVVSAFLREEDYFLPSTYPFVKACLLKPISKELIADIISSSAI
ncbi:response regulator [Rubrolithibacter danxiaensis]|uniref:response regulator n=1 Tax=Rubrolithibacter danxiaensis TaxID=3390805 RepID=UPI003BF8BCA6